MVDATLYGTSPGGHHLANLACFIARMCCLVFAVFLRATEKRGEARSSRHCSPSIRCTSSRSPGSPNARTCSASFSASLSLNSYVAYAKDGRVTRLRWAFVLYLCSLLCKQTLVTLPCVLLLLDYWPLRRREFADRATALRALVVEKLPFFALSAAFCVVELVAQVRGHSTRSLIEFPLWCALP